MQLNGADPYTWRRLIRRVRLGSSTKLVACMLADYASPDGTDVRPGNDRLVAVTELSDKTVRRALATLRDMGLIERVFEGSKCGRKGLADEYRLTFPDDFEAAAEMLPPDEMPVTPVLVTGGKPGTPVTGTGGKPRRTGPPDQEHRSPVPGTPVTSSANTGTGDRPPNQAPIHTPTNKTDRDPRSGADVEGSPPPPAAPDTTDDPDPGNAARQYRTASTYLRTLPDLGSQFMDHAAQQMPNAGMRDQVIRAAQLAKGGIPA